MLAVVVGADVDPVDEAELVDRLASTEAEHDAILGSARLPRHHPERSRDALAVLRTCTDRRTGAVVASPTTSLPEAPGHDRQFDYRYSWLRDASLAVSVASLLGREDDAQAYLRFLHRVVPETGGPAPVTDVRGGPAPCRPSGRSPAFGAGAGRNR